MVATYFKGKKPDPGPDPAKNISYYNNYKEVLMFILAGIYRWETDYKLTEQFVHINNTWVAIIMLKLVDFLGNLR